MYCDLQSSFSPIHFGHFLDIYENHSHIIQHKWVTDLYDGTPHTHTAHQVNATAGAAMLVRGGEFLASPCNSKVKGQCASVAKMLILLGLSKR